LADIPRAITTTPLPSPPPTQVGLARLAQDKPRPGQARGAWGGSRPILPLELIPSQRDALQQRRVRNYDLKRARKRLQPSGGATDPGSTAGSSGGGSDSGPGSSGTCASAITGGGRGSSESPRGDDGSARPLSPSTSAWSDAGVKASGRVDPGNPPSDLLAAGAGAKASGLAAAGAAA
jgi:hypothetical protein